MEKLFFLLLLCTSTSISYGQSDNVPRKNALKFNIIPPLLSATSEISYEHFLRSDLSIVAGIGANLSRNQSDFLLKSDSDLTFLNRDIKNRYLLAEVRHYLDFYDCNTPQGLYVGGFLRYNLVDFSSNLKFENNNTISNTEINIDFRSLNFGPLLGYQLNFNNFLFDFEFGGFGYTPNWIQLNAGSSLSNDELAQLSDALSQNFGIGRNNREIELTRSSEKVHFWYWTIRYAISIGYNF